MGGRRIVVVVVGKEKLTPRQAEILRRYFGGDVETIYAGDAQQVDVDRYCPASRLYVCLEHQVPVDAVVFEKENVPLVLKFMERGIRSVLLVTMRSADGRGDLFGGKVVTVGVGEYGLAPRVVRKVYVAGIDERQ